MLNSNIRSYRLQNEFTQKDLAKRLNVSPATVSSWEVGRTEPDMGMLERMAVVLGCTTSDLVGGQSLLLSDTERQLIVGFRRCTPERQSIILEVAGVKKGSVSTSDSQSKEA